MFSASQACPTATDPQTYSEELVPNQDQLTVRKQAGDVALMKESLTGHVDVFKYQWYEEQICLCSSKLQLFPFVPTGNIVSRAPITNQFHQLEADGVGVYSGMTKKVKRKEKSDLLPRVSLSQSENSRHKGVIERPETGAIVSQRLVSLPVSHCTFLHQSLPHTLLGLSGMKPAGSARHHLTDDSAA